MWQYHLYLSIILCKIKDKDKKSENFVTVLVFVCLQYKEPVRNQEHNRFKGFDNKHGFQMSQEQVQDCIFWCCDLHSGHPLVFLALSTIWSKNLWSGVALWHSQGITKWKLRSHFHQRNGKASRACEQKQLGHSLWGALINHSNLWFGTVLPRPFKSWLSSVFCS